MSLKDTFAQERKQMVEKQIRARGVRDARVLQAMQDVPRHEFVPRQRQAFAYEDSPIPIPGGQTISQPYIVALMSETLAPQPEDIVLEIGTGSGYQTAVLAALCQQVFTIELIPALARQARQRHQSLGYHNITHLIADGSLGWPGELSFDGILVTAGAPVVPQALLGQLKMMGQLVIPVGDRYQQMLERWTRTEGQPERTDILPVVFVPLRGRQGWH